MVVVYGDVVIVVVVVVVWWWWQQWCFAPLKSTEEIGHFIQTFCLLVIKMFISIPDTPNMMVWIGVGGV